MILDIGRFLRRYRVASSGATAIEYAMLGALISIVALTAIRTSGSSVNSLFTRVSTSTTNAAGTAPVVIANTNAGLQAVPWTMITTGALAPSVSGGSKTTNWTTPDGRTLRVIASSSEVDENAYDAAGNMVYQQVFLTANNGWAQDSNRVFSGTTLQSQISTSYNFGTNDNITNYHTYNVATGWSTVQTTSGSVGKPTYIVTPVY